jgi:hypothetical protein
LGSELGSSQISSLMETLPGIAQVLRSPVADAIVHLSRAAARLEDYRIADSDELLRYAVRRSLLTSDEADRVLAELQAAQQKRADRAADRAEHRAADRAAAERSKARPAAPAAAKPRPAHKPKPTAKPKPKPKAAARKPARPARPARPVKAKTTRKPVRGKKR